VSSYFRVGQHPTAELEGLNSLPATSRRKIEACAVIQPNSQKSDRDKNKKTQH